MAIVNNTASEIGDVIYIETNAPIIGLIALQSFTDTVGGETAERFWFKEFRYSLNGGITFTQWIELTIPNLQAVSIVAEDVFVAEYRYTRSGTDPSDLLSFTEVQVTGDTTSTPSKTKAFDQSVYKEYFAVDDVGVLNWAVNVLEKMYAEGVVPKFVVRGQDNKQRQDEDYVAYWFSVTTFFAYAVRFGREFENYSGNERLLREYLKQKDLFVCDTDDLAAMQEVQNNMLRQMRERGSYKMYETKQQSAENAHGELLRLWCYDVNTEFILGVATSECATWNIDNTSPSYTGLGGCKHMVKGYEWTDDVEDLTKYPLVQPSGTITIVNSTIPFDVTTGGMIEIDTVGIGDVTGIGDATEVTTKALVVDPNYNYEITFAVKVENLTDLVTFGCLGWNESNVAVSLSKAQDGLDETYFFTEEAMNVVGDWYWVRGIIWNANQANEAGVTTNIGVGNNLRLKSSIVKIMPLIQVDNTNGAGVTGAVNLYDIRVKPISLNYSHSYLDQGRWVDVLGKNKNGELTNDEVEEQMRRKLIPYNTSFHNVYL